MSTDLDTRLRETLDAHTSTVSPPPVDVTDLVRRGRRRRVIRSGVAVLVTAAVVVSAVAVSGALRGSPADTGGPARDLSPAGGLPIARGGAVGPKAVDGPRALFVTRQKVYLDGKSHAVRLPWDTGAHVGRLGVAYPQPGTDRPMLLQRDGTPVPLAPPTPALAGATYDDWVAADGNGTFVAWAEQTKQGSEIVAFDTGTMQEVARTTLPCHGTGVARFCPRPYVVSDGLVFIFAYAKAEVWDPATGTRKVLPDADIAQAHNKVLTTFEDRGTVDTGRIGPDWEQAKAKGIGGLLSYDGGWLLDPDGNPKVVNWRAPDESITYRPPGTVTAAVFDTDGSVLVVTHDRGLWTGWDCQLQGRCATVVPPSRQEIRLVAWDL
jgi:hypothetical protein